MYVLPHYIVSMWVGRVTFGLCLSNIFPTSVSMAEGYFRLTGTVLNAPLLDRGAEDTIIDSDLRCAGL